MSGAASGQGGKKEYARGTHAIAECQRSGQKMMYRDLVEDGHIEGLLVHPDWWEPKHPQEVPITVTDPIALYRPAPEISIPDGNEQPENLSGGDTVTVPGVNAQKAIDPLARNGTLAEDLITDATQAITTFARIYRIGETLFVKRVPTSVNLIQHSSLYEDEYWQKNIFTLITDNVGLDPDGARLAARMIDNAGGATGSVQIRQDVLGMTPSVLHTWSGSFSPDQDDWVLLSVTNLGSLTQSCYYDLTNGVLGTLGGNNSPTAAITAELNGNFRCSLAFVSDAVDVNAKPTIRVADGDLSSTLTHDGTHSIFVSQLQYEEGALSAYSAKDSDWFSSLTTTNADTPSFVVPFTTPFNETTLVAGTEFIIEDHS
jgi:hypothetical protein